MVIIHLRRCFFSWDWLPNLYCGNCSGTLVLLKYRQREKNYADPENVLLVRTFAFLKRNPCFEFRHGRLLDVICPGKRPLSVKLLGTA